MANPVPKTSTLPEGPPPYFVCKQPGSLTCTRCKNARYCSSECQTKDWEAAGSHKFVCKAFTLIGPRPSKRHFRGIFFPPDEKEPRFVWTEYEDPSNYCSRQNQPFMGDETDGNMTTQSRVEFRDAYRLGYNIDIWCKDLFVHLPINPSIERMWQRLGHVSGRWRGPLLAQAFEVGTFDEDGWEDDSDCKPLDLDTSAITSIIRLLERHQ